MNTNNYTSYNYVGIILNGIISLSLLIFILNHFIDLEYETSVILFFAAAIATAIMVMRYKQLLLYSLSFLVPLSIQMQVSGNAKINIPTEAICVFLSGFFLVKIALGFIPDRKFLRHPVTILILLDLAWLFVTSCLSGMPDVSFKRFTIRLIYYIAFYYFYYELFKLDLKNIKKIFLLQVLGFLIPIAVATVKHARIEFTMVGSQKISAPFYFDHTIYGACLVIFIPFLLHQFYSSLLFRHRLFYGFLLAVFTAATWLSFSRAAWLSLIAAMVIYLVIRYKIKLKFIIGFAVLAFLVLLIKREKLSGFISESKQVSHTNDVTMHLKSVSNISTDASNKERINRWKSAWRMFADKPLFGFGPGTYQFFYGPYQLRHELTRISTFTGNKGHAHSEYLNYLSETGLPGLLIFVSLIVVMFTKGFGIVFSSSASEFNGTALYLVCGLLTFFIHAFFNGFLEFDKISMPVLSSVAAIVCLDLKTRKDKQEDHLSKV